MLNSVINHFHYTFLQSLTPGICTIVCILHIVLIFICITNRKWSMWWCMASEMKYKRHCDFFYAVFLLYHLLWGNQLSYHKDTQESLWRYTCDKQAGGSWLQSILEGALASWNNISDDFSISQDLHKSIISFSVTDTQER